MTTLLLATTNPNKMREIRRLLAGAAAEMVTLAEWPDVVAPEETGTTFEENARAKARYYAAATGALTVAEDSGLSIDALDGAPGVHTARYAGEHASYADNCAKLVGALQGARSRAAQFRTVALVLWPDGRELAVEGVCPGTIAERERTGRGFGYDPVFVPDDGDGRTFSEMTDAEKNAMSHRGRAFSALVERLRS